MTVKEPAKVNWGTFMSIVSASLGNSLAFGDTPETLLWLACWSVGFVCFWRNV